MVGDFKTRVKMYQHNLNLVRATPIVNIAVPTQNSTRAGRFDIWPAGNDVRVDFSGGPSKKAVALYLQKFKNQGNKSWRKCSDEKKRKWHVKSVTECKGWC